MGRIFLIADGGDLVELNQQHYPSEDHLQDLLARFPGLLPGDEIDPITPRRWLLVSREAGIPGETDGGDRWSLDHLFLDQDGVPTLVEVKRSSDTRLRREVVGQMLDYAANGVHLLAARATPGPSSTLHARRWGTIPIFSCASSLNNNHRVSSGRRSRPTFRRGRIRLVFVADEIPPELQRVVEFLNSQMDPAEVLAVEIPRYAGGGLETFAPRVIGQIVAARTKKAGSLPGQRWDEPRFHRTLEQNKGAEARAVAEDLIAWCRDRGMEESWGTGAKLGSYSPVVVQGEDRHVPFALWTDGLIETQFRYLKDRPAFASAEIREQLRQRFNELPSVSIPPDGIERRPNFPIGVLSKPGQHDFFQIHSRLDA